MANSIKQKEKQLSNAHKNSWTPKNTNGSEKDSFILDDKKTNRYNNHLIKNKNQIMYIIIIINFILSKTLIGYILCNDSDQINNLQYSIITLKINSIGRSAIYFSHFEIKPDRILINGNIKENIENEYDFAEINNTIELIWYNNLKSCRNLFYGCSNINAIDLSEFDTSQVEDISYMFYNCFSLISLNLTNINTEKVKTTRSMFFECHSLISLDLSNFITSQVENMVYMFYYCISLKSLDLSTFDTYNVINITGLFYNCRSLNSLNLSNFNTSKITDMQYMFINCSSLSSLDLSNFDFSEVTSMSCMFCNCSSLRFLNFSNYNTLNLKDMSYLFMNCTSLISINLSIFDTSKVVSMYSLFQSCSSLKSLDFSNFNTEEVIDMDFMFSNCVSLISLNLSNFKTNKLLMISYFLNNCTSLTLIDLSSFKTKLVKYMHYMFNGCSLLTSLDLSNFDTTSVTRMQYMFSNCTSLKTLNLSNFDTSEVTTMEYMFSNCLSLTSLDLSNFNTQNATSMEYMFSNCLSLTSLNLSNFDTSKVISMEYMFSNCSSLTSLDLSNFDTSLVTSMENIFGDCQLLEYININKFYKNKLIQDNNIFNNIPDTVIITYNDTEIIINQTKLKSCYLINSINEIISENSNINYFNEYKNNSKCYESCVNGYILNNSSLKLCKCELDHCFSCSKNISQKGLCTKCNYNLYPIENDISNIGEYINCYKRCNYSISDENTGYLNKDEYSYLEETLCEKGYYLDHTKPNYPIFKKCYETCKTCSNYYINDSMNCISCIEGYFKLKETNNCYNDSILAQGYYFSLNDSLYHKCNIQCKTCIYNNISDESICLSCNNENGYYIAENKPVYNCYNKYTIGSHYFLKNIYDPINGINIYKWSLCYSKCETCSSYGNNTFHNCDTCIDNMLITPIGNCVYICPTNTYEYSLNKSCLEKCPDKYQINSESNKCIFIIFDEKITISEFKNEIKKNITSFVNSSSIINGSNFIAVVLSSDDMSPEKQIKNGISAIDLGDCMKVIKDYYNISKDENIIILNIESKNNNKKDNYSEGNSFNLGKNVHLEIYDFSGRKLDLGVCKEDIKVMKYIGDVDKLNIQSAKSLAEQGIDIFNAKDEFFNNICHNYNNKENKDIILNDRRKDIYQNASFCQYGCIYSGMNFNLMTADCLCNSSILQDEENNNNEKENQEIVNFKTITKSFISNLLDFNFDVLKCSNLVFNKNIIIKNIGYYCLFFMFLLQIISLVIYLFIKLKSIKHYMLIHKNKKKKKLKLNSPLKRKSVSNINNINDIKDEKKINEKNKKIRSTKEFAKELNKNKDEKNKNILFNNIFNKDKDNISRSPVLEKEQNSDNIIENKLNSNILDSIFKKRNINNNNIRNYKNSKNNIKRHILNVKNNNKNNKKEIIKKYGDNHLLKPLRKKSYNHLKIFKMKSPPNEIISEKESDRHKFKKENDKEIKLWDLNNDLQELQNLEYEEAIIYDKRTYIKIYWAFLIESNIILGTFFTKNNLNLFIIKLSFLVYTFQISFFLNALFYSDEYISDAYHNNGILDFISGLPKSIYSFIATLITTSLLKMLSNSESELMKIIKEKDSIKNYLFLINNKLRKLKNKLIVYFILVFSLGLFFLYFVTSFCAVYRNSQKYWIIGCLESFGIDSLVSIIICLFLSLFRYISVKKHIKCFFILSDLISKFL